MGIRQAPASCLSKFTSVSVAFWPPRVRSLQGTSNQPKELCILLVCVHMGLPCCSKDSPSGKAERTCSLQKHLSSVLQQGIQTQPRLTFPQSPDESQAGLLVSLCRPLPCRPCLFALVPIRTQIWSAAVCCVHVCIFPPFVHPSRSGGLESALTLATLTTLATWMLQLLSPTSDSRLSLLLPLSD